MTSELAIPGFRIDGLRTLRDVEVVCDGPLTVICGPNNAGKSSFLSALTAGTQLARGNRDLGLPDGRVAVAVDLRGAAWRNWISDYVGSEDATSAMTEAVIDVLGSSVAWCGSTFTNGTPALDTSATAPLYGAIRRILDDDSRRRPLRRDAERLLHLRSSDLRTPDRWGQLARDALIHDRQVRHISDVRRAADTPLTADELQHLAVAARRSTTGRRVEPWAETLEQILRDVFGGDVVYEAAVVGRGAHAMTLRLDGEDDIDIAKVGAGVREVVAIAYKALAAGGTDVLCIEEPENCLHPAAARRLLTSLLKRTNVQLFVTTHSPAIINGGADTVLRFERVGTVTTAQQINDARARFEAVQALGTSPADLVLAPCVIWVEGPSDRAYIVLWLATHGLHEGVDYTVGFFGGALGVHLSLAGDTDSVEAFIALRTISRRCAVVADSDRSSPEDDLKRHVKRWVESVDDDDNAIVLVTPGREVENLVPAPVVAQLFEKLGVEEAPPADDAEYAYARIVTDAVSKKATKVRFAGLALQALSDEVPPAAQGLVGELAAFVRASLTR